MKTSALLCLMLLFAGGCQPGGSPPATSRPPSPGESDDGAVWLVVLAADYPPGTGVRAILLADLTDTAAGHDVSTSLPDYYRRQMPGLRDDTWRSYQERRTRAHPLTADLFDTQVLGAPVHLLSDAELADLFAGGGWNALHRRYPQSTGIIALTLPGYAADGSQALVHVSRTMGPLAGSGQLVMLQRDGTTWRIAATARTWIS